jgi:hypothetical protein
MEEERKAVAAVQREASAVAREHRALALLLRVCHAWRAAAQLRRAAHVRAMAYRCALPDAGPATVPHYLDQQAAD